MKKTLFFAAAALALASCSQDEVLDVNRGEAISFRTIVNGNTRATDKLSFEADDQFNVWATYATANYFKQAYEFDGTDWRSTATPYYWPATVSTTSTMTFEAIWPETVGADRTAAGTFSYTVEDAAADQEDVLYAKHVSTSKETTGVKLNFRHTLSQIVVQTKNSSSTLKFDVTGVKVAFVNKAGTFTNAADDTDTHNGNLEQSYWAATDEASAASAYTQELAKATVAAEADAAALGASWILMPQTQTKAAAYTDAAADKPMAGAYLAVNMVIKNNDTAGTIIASGTDGAPIWCCFPIAIDWKPGYKYTYTIDLAGGGYFEANDGKDATESTDLDPVLDNQEIFFVDCQIDDWDEATEVEVEAPVQP